MRIFYIDNDLSTLYMSQRSGDPDISGLLAAEKICDFLEGV